MCSVMLLVYQSFLDENDYMLWLEKIQYKTVVLQARKPNQLTETCSIDLRGTIESEKNVLMQL